MFFFFFFFIESFIERLVLGVEVDHLFIIWPIISEDMDREGRKVLYCSAYTVSKILTSETSTVQHIFYNPKTNYCCRQPTQMSWIIWTNFLHYYKCWTRTEVMWAVWEKVEQKQKPWSLWQDTNGYWNSQETCLSVLSCFQHSNLTFPPFFRLGSAENKTRIIHSYSDASVINVIYNECNKQELTVRGVEGGCCYTSNHKPANTTRGPEYHPHINNM